MWTGRMRGRRSLYAAALFAVVVTLLWVAKSQQPLQASEREQVKVQSVKALTFGYQIKSLPFAANVSASKHAAMAFRIPGQLRQVYVRMGEAVTKGQLLAELDPTDYRLAVQARQAELELAEIGHERNQRLFAKQLISEDQFDRSETSLQVAQAQLAQAQKDLDDTQLRAPFDGYVALTSARSFEVVGPEQLIAQIENNDWVDVEFNLPIQYGRHHDDGDKLTAAVRFSGHSGRYTDVTLKEFASKPDPDTNSYRVTVTLPRPQPINALTGMSAWVELGSDAPRAQQLQLPKGAIASKHDGDTAMVWVINESDNTLEARSVRLSSRGIVLSGLDQGERIVAAGADRLFAGQQVRVWEREGGI